MEMPVANAVSR